MFKHRLGIIAIAIALAAIDCPPVVAATPLGVQLPSDGLLWPYVLYGQTVGNVPVPVTLDSAHATYVDTVGLRTTYSAAIRNVSINAATATDIFVIAGSASKTVRVTMLGYTAEYSSTPAILDTSVVKRSTADTGGTSTALTAVPLDSQYPAATATVTSYTANPTLGTSVGLVNAQYVAIPNFGWVDTNYNYGLNGAAGMTLHGTAESLAINANAGGSATYIFDFKVTWTEE